MTKETNIKDFIKKWTGKGNEKQHTTPYWIDLLQALGIKNPTDIANFEKPVFVNGRKKRIDVFMAETRVLVEQKSLNIDLDKPERQSDGAMLTPYQQGKRYSDNLPFSEKPSRIVVCNFSEIRIHDMNAQRPELNPVVIMLENLEKEYKYLDFLTSFSEAAVKKEEDITVEAGNIVKRLYNLLLDQYIDKDSEQALKDLNILCVRLVFLMYCEDSGIFNKNQFKDYVRQFSPIHLRQALKDLFVQLDTKVEERDPYLPNNIKAFPYINGGLFREKTEIPLFTQEIVDVLYEAQDFDWSTISSSIFGACYESTINPETRHQNGMHYTKTEDVAKLLDNLFMDDLRAEFSKIKVEPNEKKKKAALLALQEKISKIGVADFAAGSGNFGVEAYLGLRRLENEILDEIHQGQILMDVGNPIKVSIGQIKLAEINDFAADVCRVSLWIAEAQMLKETERIVKQEIDYFPLSTEAHIVTCDSLKTPWEEIVPKNEVDYIVQNPPYLGARRQEKDQKEALLSVLVDENGRTYQNAGNADYVAGWMFKAAEYIHNTNIRCAFVTTNSVTQGEQVAIIWKPLIERFGIQIDFAYRTFKWDNGTKDMAAVHCVIFGFGNGIRHKNKLIYESNGSIHVAKNINPYLVDAPTVFIQKRNTPICNVPELKTGCQRLDNDYYMFTDDEKNEFIKKEPDSETLFYRWYGSEEFINNTSRWCLYLGKSSPSDLQKMPQVLRLIENVRDYRQTSSRKQTQKYAMYPSKFYLEVIPDGNYIAVPVISSERRKYIPMGFLDSSVLCSNQLNMIPNATIYIFGVLESSLHMDWMRAVAGRLKSDYRYSKDIVYNNFPWPMPTDQQRIKIESTAKAILDARKLYPDTSFADMYGEHMYLYTELVKAHVANDKAVMEAYGIKPRDEAYTSEPARVAMLMKMYQELVEKEVK